MRAMDLEHSRLPERIGDYKLLRLIGRGGMGEVWLASKPGLAKPCALKVLLPQYSGDPRYRRRFLREADILSSLRHGRIVTVLEVGQTDGYLFIAMDYIDGVNLRALCESLAAQGRRLPVTVVGYVIGEVFEALRHAHTRTIGGVLRGVIHRDVTPDNVMISSEGEVFLSDFGIARFGADGSAEMFGKLQYMAPEQGLGTATYRSDVWSACGVLHYMLTGTPPRQALSWQEFQAKMYPAIRPTGRNDVPEPLERLRTSGLEPDPGKRLASAKDALLLLDSWMGYRKATTMLAEIYGHVVGPARSGMTDMVPAASMTPVIVQSSPPAPAADRPRRANEPAVALVEQEIDEDDEDWGSWRQRWGGEDGDDTARAGEQPGPSLDEQHTTQFVEADAPRMFRRKRVVPRPSSAPKLEATVELEPLAGTSGDAGLQTTPPLDASLLAALLSSEAPVDACPEPPGEPPSDGAPASGGGSPPATPRGEASGEHTPSEPSQGTTPTTPDEHGDRVARVQEPERRAVLHVQRTGRPRASRPGVTFFAVGFALVGLALVAGLVATCSSRDAGRTSWSNRGAP